MEICFTVNGVRHCYFLPVFAWPFNWGRPGPGPVNYPPLVQDVFVLASARAAFENIGDSAVREAALNGVNQALKAVQSRAGEHVTLRTAGAG